MHFRLGEATGLSEFYRRGGDVAGDDADPAFLQAVSASGGDEFSHEHCDTVRLLPCGSGRGPNTEVLAAFSRCSNTGGQDMLSQRIEERMVAKELGLLDGDGINDGVAQRVPASRTQVSEKILKAA